MKRASLLATVAVVSLVCLAVVSTYAMVASPRSLMARGDYEQARRAIESQARLELGSCRGLEGRERSLCQVQARADERVAMADLEAAYRGTVAAASEAKAARAKARFDVARANCREMHGADRIACLRSAHSAKGEAPAEAKLAAS